MELDGEEEYIFLEVPVRAPSASDEGGWGFIVERKRGTTAACILKYTAKGFVEGDEVVEAPIGKPIKRCTVKRAEDQTEKLFGDLGGEFKVLVKRLSSKNPPLENKSFQTSNYWLYKKE